jgi:hypothetical protein
MCLFFIRRSCALCFVIVGVFEVLSGVVVCLCCFVTVLFLLFVCV